jgi:pyridoxamine 5'-phosphate oxidase
MKLADIRKEYSLGGLRRSDLAADPLVQFSRWYEQAEAAQPDRPDANAMTLATADKSGRPSARIVLLKGVSERGFAFFTNYDSRKGRELVENPNAALVFYWADLERQICAAGAVAKLPRAESETYFKMRPRGSRLAAWASNQSGAVADRAVLEKKLAEMAAKFPGEEIPLPPHWGGFVLQPERIEFWQGRPSRLHDRFQYTRQKNNSWKLERLAP